MTVLRSFTLAHKGHTMPAEMYEAVCIKLRNHGLTAWVETLEHNEVWKETVLVTPTTSEMVATFVASMGLLHEPVLAGLRKA